MSKKHKKRKKLSRRERRAHPERAASQPTPAQPAANIPEPEAEPLTGDQPEVEAAQPIPVTTTFTPSAPRGDHGVDKEIEDVEYPAVRRDLRKLGITIVTLVLVITGLTIWNAQTGVVGELGDWMFSWWQ